MKKSNMPMTKTLQSQATSSNTLYSSILGNISNQTTVITKTTTQKLSKSLAKPQGHRATIGGTTTNKKLFGKNVPVSENTTVTMPLATTTKNLLKAKSFNKTTKQVSTAATVSPKSESETVSKVSKTRNSTTHISKIIQKKRGKENSKAQILDEDVEEGDEFSLILEHIEEEKKTIKCRKMPTSTLTQLKLCNTYTI